MEIVQQLILVIPLLITAGLSFLNFFLFIRNFLREEEVTLLHIALVFLIAALLFSLLIIAILVPKSVLLFTISILNVLTWILFLEVANAYFSAFLNRIRAIERYVLPIFGAAIGISILGTINLEKYSFYDPLSIEAVVYILAISSLLYIFIMSFKRVGAILEYFEGEELRLLYLTRQIFFISTCCIIYTSVSLVAWLIAKDITNFSFNILKWQLVDWVLFLNVPIYLSILLGAFIQTLRLDFNEIDIPTILNIIDSPRDD